MIEKNNDDSHEVIAGIGDWSIVDHHDGDDEGHDDDPDEKNEDNDLDHDGINECVIIFDTEKYGDYGSERELHIYKSNNKKWKLSN